MFHFVSKGYMSKLSTTSLDKKKCAHCCYITFFNLLSAAASFLLLLLLPASRVNFHGTLVSLLECNRRYERGKRRECMSPETVSWRSPSSALIFPLWPSTLSRCHVHERWFLTQINTTAVWRLNGPKLKERIKTGELWKEKNDICQKFHLWLSH